MKASRGELRRAASGGFEVVARTREVFTTAVPYPVTVDLPAMSSRWPMVFSYAGDQRKLVEYQ